MAAKGIKVLIDGQPITPEQQVVVIVDGVNDGTDPDNQLRVTYLPDGTIKKEKWEHGATAGVAGWVLNTTADAEVSSLD